MPLHSYPWYTADWLASRRRAQMTLEERGLYRDVLDLCYHEGSVPADERIVRRLVACDEAEFERAWPTVRACLVETEAGDLTHPRVQESLPELFRLQQLRHKRSKMAAKARWDARDEKTTARAAGRAPSNATSIPPSNAPSSNSGDAGSNAGSNAKKCHASASASAIASAIASDTLHHSSAVADGQFALRSEPSKDGTPRRGWRQEAFERFWSAVWKKVGRGDAAKAFSKAATTQETAEIIISAAREQGPRLLADAERQQRGVLHPTTWLNGQRWLDEVPAPERGADPGDLPEYRPEWEA